MSKIWYCYNCGYEVSSKGRCHHCKERFLASPLPELEVGAEDDEVGYRLEDWEDATRGRLIHSLVRGGIVHRFEADELVVRVGDEQEVDGLVAAAAETAALRSDLVGAGPGGTSDLDPLADLDAGGVDLDDEQLEVLNAQIRLLHDAAARLQADPTDMEADGDVAEASAAVFITDDLPGVDPEVWAAVGRTTRRLLGALSSEEAQEGEITRQSGILAVLLEGGGVAPGHVAGPHGAENAAELRREGEEELGGVSEGEEDSGPAGRQEETVYELPEWLPEQRAELTSLLNRAGIASSWDRGDLVVPAVREAEVEALFDGIHGMTNVDDGGDEAQYHQIEELFNATARLLGDPADPSRAADFLRAVPAVDGSPPLGFDGISWSAIRKRGRVLADSIEHKANPDLIVAEASTLRDLLRALV